MISSHKIITYILLGVTLSYAESLTSLVYYSVAHHICHAVIISICSGYSHLPGISNYIPRIGCVRRRRFVAERIFFLQEYHIIDALIFAVVFMYDDNSHPTMMAILPFPPQDSTWLYLVMYLRDNPVTLAWKVAIGRVPARSVVVWLPIRSCLTSWQSPSLSWK